MELGKYMEKVFKDFQKNHDATQAMRRLHIKKVHLKRKGRYRELNLINQLEGFK